MVKKKAAKKAARKTPPATPARTAVQARADAAYGDVCDRFVAACENLKDPAGQARAIALAPVVLALDSIR